MSGPRSPRAGGGICPFVSCPVHDVVEGAGDSVMAIGQCQGALEPCALRALGSGMALGSD